MIASAVEVFYETTGQGRPPPGLVRSLIPEAGKAPGKGLYPGLVKAVPVEDVKSALRSSHGLIRVHGAGSGCLSKASSAGPLPQLRLPEVQGL